MTIAMYCHDAPRRATSVYDVANGFRDGVPLRTARDSGSHDDRMWL